MNDCLFDDGTLVLENGWENHAPNVTTLLPGALALPPAAGMLMEGQAGENLIMGNHGTNAADPRGHGPPGGRRQVFLPERKKPTILLFLIGVLIGLLCGWRLALRQHTKAAELLAEQNREREEHIREAMGGASERSEAYKAGWRAAVTAPQRQKKLSEFPFALPSFWS